MSEPSKIDIAVVGWLYRRGDINEDDLNHLLQTGIIRLSDFIEIKLSKDERSKIIVHR